MRQLLLGLLLGLGACATGPADKIDSLNQARDRWSDQGLASYAFTMRRGCFCGGPLLVEVVVSPTGIVRTDVDTGQPVSAQQAQLFPDVPGLFEVIAREIARPAASLAVTYHSAAGYPLTISVDPIKNAIDDEYSITVTDFRAIP